VASGLLPQGAVYKCSFVAHMKVLENSPAEELSRPENMDYDEPVTAGP